MSWTPRYTLILSGIVALGYIGLVVYFLWSLHGTYSVESTRLLLVLTLTIAMFGFGGLLIARALFADDADGFQNRFRLAREIFLVFSGIFGTIIGFYFGTSDQDAGTSPAIEVAFADGQVSAAVTGGAEPFIGIMTKKDEPGGAMMTANKRLLTYAAAPCPQDASVLVVDGRGRRAEATVECNLDTSGTEGTNTTDNATNATGNARNPADNTVTNNSP